MRTIKKFKIFWAIVCTIVAIVVCCIVSNEWKAQGCDSTFSMLADWIVYCGGCIGLYIGGTNLAEFVDYWAGNGDVYYKGRRY